MDNIQETTVLVIGSGPAGAVVSHTLASAGIDVLCLEQGDWVNPGDYAANHRMWELVARSHWATEPNYRQNWADFPLDVKDADLPPSMYAAVGGSTIHFGGLWPRLVPSDFCVKSLDGVADDWPISYEDLEPFYRETDAFIGVAGLDGDPAYPDGLEYPQAPHPLGLAGMRTAEAMNKLGWHWWPHPLSIPTHKHGDLTACARWGTCVQGCPESAKASFDLAYWPAAIRAGAKLQTGARVSRILTDAQGRASGVKWIDPQGEEHEVRAKYVVVCANGIGTPRLLLLSASSQHPQGLANSSGLVGKNLMLHPHTVSLGYYEDDLETWRGPLGAFMASYQFYETDKERGFERGIKMMASTAPGLLFYGVDAHRELPFEELWGANFHRAVTRARSTIMWSASLEDLPEESNRVTLSDTIVDGSGLPVPVIEYKYSENMRRKQRFSMDRMNEAHVAAGATKIIEVPLMPGEPGHLMGTARMGEDPSTSVVDSYGRAHDVPGLLIADGSVFVTGGAANPTSTIAALALRIGRQLAKDIALERAAQS